MTVVLPIVPQEHVPEAEYRSYMRSMPIVAVDIVFVNRDKTKVLLGRRSSLPYQGEWFAFGGRLLKNEEFAEAAARQAAREAGISLSSKEVTLAGVYNEISGDSKYPGVSYHAVVLVCWCFIDELTPTLDPQHSEAAWISVDDRSLHQRTKDRIDMVLESIEQHSV